jgi:hypothetical protein
MDRPIILDACCVLNLAATGHFEEILGGLPWRWHVGHRARAEAHWLWAPDGEARDQVDLDPLMRLGLLDELELELAQEEALFVEFSATLADGEAEAAALAVMRVFALDTDDRKARRVVGERSPGLQLYTTLEIIRAWQICCAVTDADIAASLCRVSDRATYRPRRTDPLWDWWDTLVGER